MGILNYMPNSAANFALRKLKDNYNGSCVRVRRSNDNAEQDIGFVGLDLDTGGMLVWSQGNLVAGIPLGVDGGSGVSAGWTLTNNLGASTILSVSDNKQVLTMTNASSNNTYNRLHIRFNCVAGNIYSGRTTCEFSITSGNPFVTFYIAFRNSGGSSVSSNAVVINSAQTLIFSLLDNLAPTNTAYVDIIIELKTSANASSVPNSCILKLYDAYLSCSNQSIYVSKIYDQSGFGNDAIQATTTNQPRIVNAGIIDRDFDAIKCNALWPTFASASGVNLISNGDFSNGTTGWVVNFSTNSASNNTLSNTGNGSVAVPETYQLTNIAVTTGKRYYVCYKVRVTNSSCTQLVLDFIGTISGGMYDVAKQSNPVVNQWYTLSAVVSLSSLSGNIRFDIKHQYADAATANGKVMEVQEVVCIDVTNYGRPTLVFDGATDCLINTANHSSIDITAQPLYLNSVFSTDLDISADGYIMSKNLDTATLQYGLLFANATPRVDFRLEGSTTNSSYSADNIISKSIQTIQSASWNNDTMQNYNNGGASGNTDVYSAGLTSRANFTIGARSNTANNSSQLGHFKGKISEIHIFPSVTNRKYLETDQAEYYSLTVPNTTILTNVITSTSNALSPSISGDANISPTVATSVSNMPSPSITAIINYVLSILAVYKFFARKANYNFKARNKSQYKFKARKP